MSIEKEAKILLKLKKKSRFKELIEKITLGTPITFGEKKVALSIAILFLKEFEKDRQRVEYFEFAYYIILNYSLTYQDFRPLYDLSVQCGFFPISKFILDHSLTPPSVSNLIVNSQLDLFSYENKFIQTLEQYQSYKQIMKSSSNNIAFIAPTSYGKSSIIVDLIKRLDKVIPSKIGIIVPTQSLLMQTFNIIKNNFSDRKVVLHNDMCNSSDKHFIAIFTQERTLRFFKKQQKVFDVLFIDEAHNLFSCDESYRNIILAWVIRENLEKNPNLKLFYFSPFVSDSKNLRLFEHQNIQEQRINLNLKSLDIFYFSMDNTVQYYNRFLNIFINTRQLDNNQENIFKYILETSCKKEISYIYLGRPKAIEDFARKFADQIQKNTSSKTIETVVSMLEKYLHKDFYGIDTIKRGVIYLHGKLPTHIKEYLESKIIEDEDSKIRFIVANNVILEGVNLPLNQLYILNVEFLDKNQAINLMGRVNRLNNIFSKENKNLNKLCPKIHYIDSALYKTGRRKMKKLIMSFNITKRQVDKVKNPLLSEFKVNKDNTKLQKKILENEKILKETPYDEFGNLKHYLIKNNIAILYGHENSIDVITKQIFSNIKKIRNMNTKINLISKIYFVFIQELKTKISDYEFKRLANEAAQKFYSNFIKKRHMQMSERIDDLYRYLQKRRDIPFPQQQEELGKSKNRHFFYFGKAYGEVIYPSEDYPNSKDYTYINLKDKSDKELVNLAIIKLEIEDNFIEYTLGKLVEMLYDFNLISECEYNIFRYGTDDEDLLGFSKIGLSPYLMQRIEQSGLLPDISINKNGTLSSKSGFQKLMSELDDFEQFQLKKFITTDAKS